MQLKNEVLRLKNGHLHLQKMILHLKNGDLQQQKDDLHLKNVFCGDKICIYNG